MNEKVKFYLDEHIPNAVAAQLRKHGVDVVTVPEVRRKGYDDSEQLAWAYAHQRVMVTQDSDYIALHSSGASHVGIAYFADRADIGYLVNVLLTLYGVYNAEEMVDRLEYL